MELLLLLQTSDIYLIHINGHFTQNPFLDHRQRCQSICSVEHCVHRDSYTFSMAGCQGGGTASQYILGSNAESQGIISHILADGIIEGTGLLSVEIKPDIICRAISDLEDHYG